MRTSDVDILLIPAIGALPDDHWQARWQAKLSSARLVQPDDPESTDFGVWAKAIQAAVKKADKPVVLVAHSTGITALLHAVPDLPKEKIAGAFLVAVYDPEDGCGVTLTNGVDRDAGDMPALDGDAGGTAGGHAGGHAGGLGASPTSLPRAPLPFPALLIASNSCSFCNLEQAKSYADSWGATLVGAGDVGHIDTASGHGPWPEGLMRFGLFLKSLG